VQGNVEVTQKPFVLLPKELEEKSGRDGRNPFQTLDSKVFNRLLSDGE
jgi:hypothetical protein